MFICAVTSQNKFALNMSQPLNIPYPYVWFTYFLVQQITVISQNNIL